MQSNNINYSRELEKLMEKNRETGVKPKLMLHVCCAVCASYVIEYLSDDFDIHILYYNPNITRKEEYEYRLSELKRYVEEGGYSHKLRFTDCEYDPEKWLESVKGLENEKEGGRRCSVCFAQRLSYAKEKCDEYGCDYFATTLTISPLKNAKVINSIGLKIGEKYLPTDFKKKEGYKRSIELSKQYSLYRQNYCGCIYSRTEEFD